MYSCGKDLPKIKMDLICTMKNILKWFRLNSLNANPGKFQFIILGDKTCYEHILKINLTCVQSSDGVTLWGVIIDNSLIHHRTLQVIYDIDDSYNNLLLRKSSVSIHQRHNRFLVTEIFKNISQINAEFMRSFFKQKKLSYNLRKVPIPILPRTQSTYYSTNVVHFQVSLVWNNLPAKVKSSNSVFEFKTKVKNPGNIDCGCLICR